MNLKCDFLIVHFVVFLLFFGCTPSIGVDVDEYTEFESIDLSPYGITATLYFPEFSRRELSSVKHELDSFDWELEWLSYPSFILEDWGEVNPMSNYHKYWSKVSQPVISSDSVLVVQQIHTDSLFKAVKLMQVDEIYYSLSSENLDKNGLSFFMTVQIKEK